MPSPQTEVQISALELSSSQAVAKSLVWNFKHPLLPHVPSSSLTFITIDFHTFGGFSLTSLQSLSIFALFYICSCRGITSLGAGPSCALWWICWSQLELAAPILFSQKPHLQPILPPTPNTTNDFSNNILKQLQNYRFEWFWWVFSLLASIIKCTPVSYE